MKRYDRACFKKAQTPREQRILQLKILYPPYYDDGYYEYPTYRRGYKNPKKCIYWMKVREYRSWKYNRKNQYK